MVFSQGGVTRNYNDVEVTELVFYYFITESWGQRLEFLCCLGLVTLFYPQSCVYRSGWRSDGVERWIHSGSPNYC